MGVQDNAAVYALGFVIQKTNCTALSVKFEQLPEKIFVGAVVAVALGLLTLVFVLRGPQLLKFIDALSTDEEVSEAVESPEDISTLAVDPVLLKVRSAVSNSDIKLVRVGTDDE